MENHKKQEMLQQITNKLGFDIREYDSRGFEEGCDKFAFHEKDNVPNPFEKLSLEELLFLRENNYFISTKKM